jgi:hypothetical protein
VQALGTTSRKSPLTPLARERPEAAFRNSACKWNAGGIYTKAKEGEFRGLPTRKTCHKAGPPVYEPAIRVASCVPRGIADSQRRRVVGRRGAAIGNARGRSAKWGEWPVAFAFKFCDDRKRNFAFAAREMAWQSADSFRP